MRIGSKRFKLSYWQDLVGFRDLSYLKRHLKGYLFPNSNLALSDELLAIPGYIVFACRAFIYKVFVCQTLQSNGDLQWKSSHHYHTISLL